MAHRKDVETCLQMLLQPDYPLETLRQDYHRATTRLAQQLSDISQAEAAVRHSNEQLEQRVAERGADGGLNRGFGLAHATLIARAWPAIAALAGLTWYPVGQCPKRARKRCAAQPGA